MSVPSGWAGVIMTLHNGGMAIDEIAYTVSDLDWGSRYSFFQERRGQLERDGLGEADICREMVDLARKMNAGIAVGWEGEKHWSIPAHLAKPGKRKIGRALSRQVFERDRYRCVHCGTHLDLCCDHVVAESKGGATTLDNLQTLCRPCNSRKGAK